MAIAERVHERFIRMMVSSETMSAEPGRRYFRDFSPGDDFHQLLIDAHRDLTDEHSSLLNAKLVPLLASHIGDLGVIGAALERTREDVAGG